MMAPLASWLWLVAVSASPQDPSACLSPAPAPGLYASDRSTEVCHPDSGCHDLNLQVAVVGGCLGLPPVGKNVQVLGHAQDGMSVSRTIRQTGPVAGAGCRSKIHVRWARDGGVDDAIIVDVRTTSLCSSAKTKRDQFRMRRTTPVAEDLSTAMRLLGDNRPQVAVAAVDHLSTFRERPAVCEALATVISSGPPDLANRVLLVADAPCMLGASVQALESSETRRGAELALISHVESRMHLRTILVDAALNGISLPKMARRLQGQLRASDRDKMLSTLLRTNTVVTIDAIATVFEQTDTDNDAGAFLLNAFPRFGCPVVTTLGSRAAVVSAFSSLSHDDSDALLSAIDRNWSGGLCPGWDRARSALERAQDSRNGNSVIGAAADMAGQDPMDLDDPSDDAAFGGTSPPRLLEDAFPDPVKGVTRRDDTLLEGEVAAAGNPDEAAELPVSARDASFSDGLSVSPYVAATAFLDGPMAGAGLMLAWNLGSRFSVVAGGSASFSCPICFPDSTGTRTDLRAEIGLQAVAFPEQDLGPFGRISLVGNHAEVVQQRRAVLQDALGLEVTVGLDWVAANGLRLFLEGGGFALNEVTRSVRPEGQAAPAPSGVVPADLLAIGVQVRVGVSFGL